MTKVIVAGIDGTRTGWIIALLHLESIAGKRKDVTVSLYHIASLWQLTQLQDSRRPQFVAIDMPLGLSLHAERGGRACDRAARGVLAAAASASRGVKRKRSQETSFETRKVGPSSIFTPPTRAALDVFINGADHKTVSAANIASCTSSDRSGLGLSIQSFHIMPKVRELDDFVCNTQNVSEKKTLRFAETHPEVGFLELKRRVGVELEEESKALSTKKSEKGRVERLQLLCDTSSNGGRIPLQQLCTLAGLEYEEKTDMLRRLAKQPTWMVATLQEAKVKIRVPTDDILDAFLCAHTAARLVNGEAQSLPLNATSDQLVDANGLPMRIWF